MLTAYTYKDEMSFSVQPGLQCEAPLARGNYSHNRNLIKNILTRFDFPSKIWENHKSGIGWCLILYPNLKRISILYFLSVCCTKILFGDAYLNCLYIFESVCSSKLVETHIHIAAKSLELFTKARSRGPPLVVLKNLASMKCPSFYFIFLRYLIQAVKYENKSFQLSFKYVYWTELRSQYWSFWSRFDSNILTAH